MLPYVILYQLLAIHVSVSVYVEVPVFSKYKMPCNISHLPKTPDLQKFVWYQDGRINRAINEIILSHGEIPFDEITPDASGTYMCCYDTSNFSFCAEKIRLYVKCNCDLAYFVVCLWISAFSYLRSVSDPRPKIFFDTFLNITAPVYTGKLSFIKNSSAKSEVTGSITVRAHLVSRMTNRSGYICPLRGRGSRKS